MRKRNRHSSHVYILKLVDTPYIKVGVTSDIAKRLIVYRVHNPHDVIVLLLKKISKYGAEGAEQAIMRLLRPYHTRGEWFEISPSELPIILNSVDVLLNTILIAK